VLVGDVGFCFCCCCCGCCCGCCCCMCACGCRRFLQAVSCSSHTLAANPQRTTQRS
jgi:hypothetical protein